MTCRPRRPAALLAAVLLLAGCAQAADSPPHAPDAGAENPDLARLLRVAGAMMADGSLAEAGRLLDEARALEPDNPDVWVAIARLRFRGGEHLTALDAANRALELGPGHAPALLMRALMVRDAHGFADSLPWFDAALAADSSNADAWAEYAATLGDFGYHGEMLRAVRKLAEIAPADRRVFFLQAVLAQRGGKAVLARSLLERSGMAARGVPAAVLLDALISLEQGNHDSAAERLEMLAVRQPANARLRELLVRALLLGGRETEVVERFAADAARPEASPYLAMLVARAHERLGDRASAAALLERAYAPPGGTPVALAQRAGLPQATSDLRASAAAGNPGAAQVRANGLRARFPLSGDIAQLAGDAALLSGDAPAALEAYTIMARVRRPWLLTRKAMVAYRSTGDDAAADTLLARHVAGEPENIPALIALAQGLGQRADWERTALLLDHAIALGGGYDPGLLHLRAKAARALGNSERSERFAALAADLAPALIVR
ncbi:MAG: hypothetical protein NXH71_01765 [Erythrobacteraceae bacterium]|nr:hypothetical protein [Erythrobacteraceae bacterium]